MDTIKNYELSFQKRTNRLKVRLQGGPARSSCAVLRGDVEASNGILHIVDRVLFKLPPIKGHKQVDLLLLKLNCNLCRILVIFILILSQQKIDLTTCKFIFLAVHFVGHHDEADKN